MVLVLEGVFIFCPAVALTSFTVMDLAIGLQKMQDAAFLLANEQEKSEFYRILMLEDISYKLFREGYAVWKKKTRPS
ncbi:MAG: hypothetical protein V7L22_02350 [Nostoc sp.]|uniref:hypothetical protein n=1 Tax=Nostoc sp. TaxID=1180 RepID=UPI002FF7CBD0